MPLLRRNADAAQVRDDSVQKPIEPLVRPPLLHHTVQEAIKDYILTNRLRPGDSLPSENELARQLGVGRNSVREAVKSLDSLGVLEARRGSGLFIRDFSVDPVIESLSYGALFELRELAELFEVRRVLESGMIEAAMAVMTEADYPPLRALIASMEAHSQRGDLSSDDDRAFHHALFAGTGNATLLSLLDAFWLTYQKAAAHADLGTADPVQTYRNHAAILDAVLAGDVEGARAALLHHYADITARLERVTSS